LGWISSLRFTSPEDPENRTAKKKEPTQSHPPSFFEKDMEKWQKEKFQTALEDRKQAKALLLKAK
jgi:hypothetical protein